MPKKTLKRISFNPNDLISSERFGFTSKKDMPPIKSDFTPPKYTYVVEWQMEEEKVSIRGPE